MSLFRSLLIDKALNYDADAPELYLIYSTDGTTNIRLDFDTTAELIAFTSYNADLVSAKVVRKNLTESDTSLANLFRSCTNLVTVDLSEFDSSGVINMSYMFYACNSLTSLDLSNLDTSSVSNMDSMFRYCYTTSINLSNFDTSNVSTMASMFYACSASSLDLSSFNTSNVSTMAYMFHSCTSTSINLSSFDTSNVETMAYMFYACSATSLDLSNFNTSNVSTMAAMFRACSASSLDLSNFDTSNVSTMYYMCRYCINLTSLKWATSRTSLEALQENSYLGSSGNTIYVPSTLLDDYKQATYFSDWAEQIVGLDEDGNIVEPEVEVANPELYLVYNTSSSSNTTIEFSTTSAMETWLATNRNNLTGSLKAVRKNVDDNYTDYSYFFPLYTDDWEASITSLDLSEFYTDGATSMEGMFTEAYGLTSLDLSTFDMSQVANINYFLAGTSLTTLNLSNIDTSSITTCEAAFSSANIGTVYWATNKTSVQTITDVPLAPTIYVPSNLVSAYKSDSNFSQVASSIIGI